MKKRLLSMLLALVMVLSMLPVTALAAEVVSVTVYRDPVVDYVTTTDQKDFFNYIKRDISNETVNAWYKTIYNSVLGEIPSSGSITYYVSTLDGYYDVNGTWAAYFGHAAVAGGNASKDTEKVIVKADTEYEAKVTVKGYIDVAFEIVEEVFSTKVSLGDSNKITNGYTFEKALNDANAAAKTKESVLNEESQFIQYEFLGWDKDGNGTVDAIDTSKVTTSNAAERDGDTYTAIYKKSYLITWVDEDGTELDSEYVAEGDTPSYDGTPTKEGWTFSAWSPEIKAVTEAATYTATYTQNAADEVTVTFDSNGGSSVKSQTVTVGEKAEEPEEPTKEGYTFEGWLLDGVKFDFSTPVTQDITLTADWKAITYTVTLDYNNGEANGEETVTYGDTLSIDDPTWEGYTFEGWYTEDDKPYDDEAIKEDVTLTAHWSTTPKVKLSEDSITITYGENVKLRNVLDGVYVGDNAIDAKGKVGFDTEIDELPVGEHTVDVAFEGYTENGITYNDSSAKLTVIVNKATANVTVNSQTIKYSELGDMLPLVERTMSRLLTSWPVWTSMTRLTSWAPCRSIWA